ncbi:MAG: hypothetical protein AB3N14_09570 [Flavobacteriaceae bacterium]
MQNKYVEKDGFNKRIFELKEDRIEIEKKGLLSVDYKATVLLNELRLPKDIVYTQSQLNMLLGGAPGVIFMGLTIMFNDPILKISSILWYCCLFGSVLGMFIGFGLAKKKIHYAYKNISGGISFDIGEIGNKREDFERFCSKIDDRITNGAEA